MKRQRGMTLISMMVGLVISMFSIVAMLSLYRSLVQSAVVATRDANLDGQIAAGLLSAQLEIQSAGFGIEAAGNADLTLATTNLDSTTRALLWRLVDTGTYRCRGLLERSVNDSASGQSMRVLSLLQANSCDASGALSGKTWAVVGDLAEFRGQNLAQVVFQISTSNCWPFGVGDNSTPSAHALVTLSAPSSSQLAGAVADPISYSVCLPNIKPV
ncbi:PilW family protein [Pseudomonas sp. UBA6310]|uniref:PilW family protein n=1 Tax=Pseudomonas sp. UBA6310 TaxID=1947327 RepID=UPI00257AED71|nr:prepilin-type N-terminal cleavage/methylation domain-containing protein [Pseudomonas sp. UBA6310]